MRYAIGVEYDGSGFYGWQTQRQEPTVQASLESALAAVADHPVRVACAGRTDTGVHAICQVAHFDSEAERTPRSWILGANSNLPPGVCLLWVKPVDDDFHARFSALARSYRYVIANRWVRPSLDAGRVCWERRPLDAAAMREGAQALLGEHDFSAFRSAGCSANHPVREVQSLDVRRDGDRVVVDITANGFLYHMVRNIAGTLLKVGRGEQAVDWVREILEGRDRRLAGATASPDGLYFCAARYPERFGLPTGDVAFPMREGD